MPYVLGEILVSSQHRPECFPERVLVGQWWLSGIPLPHVLEGRVGLEGVFLRALPWESPDRATTAWIGLE